MLMWEDTEEKTLPRARGKMSLNHSLRGTLADDGMSQMNKTGKEQSDVDTK